MANDFNDIDQLFRNRFEDYKDHSVNPSSQWGAFERMLDAEQPVATGSKSVIIKFVSNWYKPISIAASVALLVSVSLYTLNEQNQSIDAASIKENSEELVPQSNQTFEAAQSFIRPTELISEPGILAINGINSENPSENTTEIIYADINSATANNSSESPYDLIPAVSSRESNLLNASNQSGIEILDNANSFIRNDADFMPRLSLNAASSDLIQNTSLPEFNDYAPNSALYGMAFVRLGVRFGNGESNNEKLTNFWTGNAVASVGYKKPLKGNFGVMAELAYLRRSGNGLERNQNLEVDKLYTAFNNSVNPTSDESAPVFTVDRSIVATRLDYVQIPVTAYFEPTRKTELNAGAYVDYLVRAQNETYLVYNQKDYVSRQPTEDELRSLDGLNKIRFGLSAGARYDIMKNISLDLKALIPLNSAFHKSATISATSQANQSIDFMLGLRYTI